MPDPSPCLTILDPAADDAWRDALRAHLTRLDPAARQSRFLAPLGERGIAALVARATPVALVVFAPDGHLRGCAELHPGEAAGSAEIAVSVEAPWQHRGIGARLTETARAEALRRGFTDIRLTCLRRNLPMMRIARRLSATALPLPDWALALFRLDPPEGSCRPAPGDLAAG